MYCIFGNAFKKLISPHKDTCCCCTRLNLSYWSAHTDTLIGTVITQVTGNDVDSGPALFYTLTLDMNSRDMFGIHRYGGGVSLTGPLDYEERTWYTVTVSTSDSKHHSEANLTVLVDDVNDNAPTFTQDMYQVWLLLQPQVISMIVSLAHGFICPVCLSLGDCIRAPPSRQCGHHSHGYRP